MLEPYDGKLSRTVLRREGGGNTADPADYSPLVNRLKGQVIKISPNSTQFINPMDINANYSEEDNPLSLKADFILSLCELVVGGKEGLLPVEKTVIDRCVHLIYRKYFADPCPENMPILEDLYNALLQQDEKEAHHVATALEIYVKGSLNLFNHRTNVNVNNRIVCYDIKELGKQMKKLGMLIVQDQVWGRVTANRSSGKSTRYYMDEMHLLLKEEQTAAYSVEIWKRFRKWGGIPTGLTQNVKDLLSSREVENIFENSDMIIMLNQAAGDRQILAKQLNISPHQLSYVTHSGEGEGLLFFGNVILLHNHIIYNSTALDSTRKFWDFLLSGLAVQRLSDLICLEHQLSVIEIKPYRERQKRTLYPPRESNRDKLCAVIDNILLSEKPASFEGFLQKLEQRGYEIKRGKYTSVKGTRQKRFIRFRTLGAGYSEDEIKAVIAGDAEHCPHQKQPPKEQPFHLLVDIQAKLSEGKSEGYARWAKKYNLKEMSKTLIFLQEKKIGSIKKMQERVDAATARYHELGDSIKAAETRMAEIAVLRTHIVNYAKTRPVYDAYRKAGYSKRFLENHRAEITLHKAAKAAFDESNLKTLPKVKELDAEYSKLLTEKKALYPDYRKAKDEMQELLRAQRNVELFFAEEKNTTEKTQSR